MWSSKKSTLVDTVYQHSVPHANLWENKFRSWKWKEVIKLKFCQCTMVAVIFKTWNLILNYCFNFVPESCLPGITLMLCFKVVLTVALSSYVIRYENLNPPYITWLPSDTKLYLRAPTTLLLQLSHLFYSLFSLT